MLGMYSEPLFARAFNAAHINRNSKPLNALRILRTLYIGGLRNDAFRAGTVGIWLGMKKECLQASAAARFLNDALLCGMDKQDFLIVILGAAVMLVMSILQEKGINVRDTLAKQVFTR